MNKQAEKTRQNISEAFLVLLQEKPLNAISIKEITDKAGISRVAFYYHHTDIYALFESIQKEAIQTIVDLLEESLRQEDSSYFEKKLFTYVDDNQILLALLVKEGLAPAFIFEALDAARVAHAGSHDHLREHLEKFENSVFVDYQFIYMAGGTLFMIFDWIAKKHELRPEKVALLAEVFNQQVGSLTPTNLQ